MVETRRSSSSSKRPLSSPSSSLPNGKRSKAADASSSSTNNSPSSEEVVGAAAVKELDTGSADLASGDGGEKQSDDVAAAEKSPQAVAAVDSTIDGEKGKSSGPCVNRGKKRQLKSNAGVAWGKLLSQFSQNPHVVIHRPTFTVGQGRQCDLWVRDPTISKSLCSLKHTESEGGESLTLLEITGEKGFVQVNGKIYSKDSTILLNGGDEVVFSSSGKHAYIFQQLTNISASPTDMPPSVNLLEAHGGSIKGVHIEARSDPSAVSIASVLASSSNHTDELSLIPPSSQDGDDVECGFEIPSLPSACEVSDNCVDTEMKDASDHNDGATVSVVDKAGVSSPNVTNEDLNVDTESGKTLAENNDFRPFLQILAGSTSTALDISGSVSRILDEHRAIRNQRKNSDPPISISSRRQAFKDTLRQGLLHSKNIEVSFENFPYYLSETTKNVLIASTYIHLKCNKFAKFTSDLPTVCPRILLSGPAGSEIYQETLTKALAKYFGAGLLTVDTILLPGGPTTKEADPIKESLKPERTSVFSKRTVATVHLKKPASSVEADITGGSTISSQALPKQEASTATSKSYAFKKGDRVKYVGSLQSGFSPAQTPIRGPTYGYRGKVVLAFEGNVSSKIGVRFDRTIPEGNDLGGLCEEDHGFFCAADLLRLESSSADDVDKLAINELFEVASIECKSSPLILYLKDIEKSMAANPEAYAALKVKLDTIPENIVVIASHTQLDSRKEKSHPGGLLFTKFGSNQTALLDLAFPDETVLVDWKQQLDRDIETMKLQSNIGSIRSESKGSIESEQGLTAKVPMDDDLKNEDLANTSQVTKKTDTFDATKSEYESSESSSEDDEVPEESSGNPTGEVFVQASIID